MKKDNTDVKETENKDAAPLLDGELENVAGGVTPGYVNRWRCCQCSALGHWSDSDDFINREKDLHSQETGHTYFGFFSRRIGTFNPGED